MTSLAPDWINWGECEAERLRGLLIGHEIEFGRQLDEQSGPERRFLARRKRAGRDPIPPAAAGSSSGASSAR
jgi:hypothetical protein